MATELHWPRRATFVESSSDGSEDNTEERRYEGPGTFEVPDEMVDQYLSRGWERPESEEGTEAPSAVPSESDPDADPEGEADESEADFEESSDDEFDAAGFIDGRWQSVKAAIESGEADGHLDAVQQAEENRDRPRSSIIEAIEERK